MLPLVVILQADMVGRITRLCPAAAPGGEITVVLPVSPKILPCGSVRLPLAPKVQVLSLTMILADPLTIVPVGAGAPPPVSTQVMRSTEVYRGLSSPTTSRLQVPA